jgi:hypothetical protein
MLLGYNQSFSTTTKALKSYSLIQPVAFLLEKERQANDRQN